MHHNPKIANLVSLLDFFERGAPEWAFDMWTGLERRIDTYSGKPIPSTCGSAGCIAGAAVALMAQQLPAAEAEARLAAADPRCADEREHSYAAIEEMAGEWLGLTLSKGRGDYCKHPLFEPTLAPPGCTPEQAAQAIRNVIAGNEEAPWKGVD